MSDAEMKNEQTNEYTTAGTAETAGKKPTGRFSKKQLGIIGAIAVIIIALLIGIGISHSSSGRLRKQLDLGQRYLEEMKYEEAVVAFNNAIEIDPMSVDAYLGLVEVYIRTGDFETALSYAQKGYDLTGDERLKEKIDMIESGNITASNGWSMKESHYESGKLIYYEVNVYDLQGRNKSVLLYNGADQLVDKGDYEYDEQGRRIVGWASCIQGDNPLGLNKVETDYDAAGREIAIRHYDEDGNLFSYDEKEYDAAGRQTAWRQYDASGRLADYSEYEYDAAGRTTTLRDYDASGNLIGSVEYEYDAEGRKTVCRNYDASGNLLVYSEYEYDAEGRTIAIRSYDASGNLTSEMKKE